MLLRVALFLVMAAGLGGFGMVAWISTRQPPARVTPAQPAAAQANAHVLAAARTLQPGTLLKPDDLATLTVAASAVPAGARQDTLADRADLLGAMVRRPILAGEVLLPAYVMRAGDRGFLAAVLGPGQRAATVAVDAVTGTAGLIWPGDHVDLILTETIDDPAVPQGRRTAGETVLHNVRVIAIDQELMQGATAASVQSGFNSTQSRTVTLEVSPRNAERVAVATRLGHLFLSVISADTPDAAAAAPRSPVTWAGDVSAALRDGQKSPSTAAGLHLYEGSGDGKEFHF